MKRVGAHALAAALALSAGSAGAQEAARPQVALQSGSVGAAAGAAEQVATAAAGPRIVRGGAHPGFDRLVVPLAPGERWQLRRDGADHLLAITPARPGAPRPIYVLDGVFLRIGRARLQRLAAEPDGSLRLTLGCECRLTAFAETQSWVAIDIADPAGRPPRSRPVATTRAASAPAPSVPLTLPLPAASEAASLLLPEPNADALAGPSRPPEPAAGPASAAQPVTATAPSGDLARARTELGARVEQAIAEGLLTPTRRPARPARPGMLVPGTAEVAKHLSTHSALDAEPASGPDAAASSCPDPADLDIAAWGGEGAPNRQIAAARTRLLGEFDRPVPGAALTLARLYVYHGLGAEARAVLTAFPEPSPDAAALTALASVVDDPDGTWAPPPSANPGCPGPAALWDLFRAESPAALGAARLQEAVALFTALPAHLRRQLGPAAARRLEAAGRAEAAALVRAATERAEPERATHASGAQSEAAAVEALLAQAEGLLDAGAPLPSGLQKTLAALGFELGHHPLGGRIAGAVIRAHAADGAHAAAYDAWAEADGPGLPKTPLPASLAGALLDSLIATAPPEAVATIFFRHRARVLAGIDGSVRRRALALRMLEAGLAPEADGVLAGTPGMTGATEVADRLVGARIALARSRAAAARTLLDGLETPEALALRLQAELSEGAFTEAQQTARRIGDPEAIAVADWRAGDRAGAAHSAGQTHRTALAMATPPAPETGPSLGASRAAITRSQETRAALERLLADPDPRPRSTAPPALDTAADPTAVTESQDLTGR